MSRTLNGNLTGAAAHRSWDDVPSEPLEPEILLAIYRDIVALEKAQAETDTEFRAAHLRVADTWQAKIDAMLAADGIPQDGTYPSPIIYGGDIVEIIPQAGDDEIPF